MQGTWPFQLLQERKNLCFWFPHSLYWKAKSQSSRGTQECLRNQILQMNLQGHLNPLARERLTLRLRVPSDPSWHASLDCPRPLQHVEPGARSSGVDWIHAFALSFPWHQMCNHCITCLPDFEWLNVARGRPRAFLPHCDKKAFFFVRDRCLSAGLRS